MNELEKRKTFKLEAEEAELLDLRAVEARIAVCMQSIAINLLQIGRYLAIAKEANLVPHGKWEEWVRINTGMSERRAQRLMQAASIAPEGSRIASLPVSKIMALLPLPEEQREDMASVAISEDLTVKQLRAKVAELQEAASRAQESAAAADQDKLAHAKEVERMRKILENQISANDRLIREKGDMERRSADLEKKLDDLLRSGAASEIRPEVQKQIDDLRRQLEEAQEYAAEQADMRQRLEQEQLNAAMMGDDPATHAFGVDDLTAAVAEFIGRAGILVHMGAELNRMRPQSREIVQRNLERVRVWLDGVDRAMKVCEVRIEE